MDNPGTFDLIVAQLGAAVSAKAFDAITDLDGIAAASLECRFQYGSGGTSTSVLAQVTFDKVNWLDVARFDFTVSSAVKVANLNTSQTAGLGTYEALAAEGINDGILAGTWRGVMTSGGTYINSTVSLRLAAR